jgi:hypothetical protein
MKTALSRERFSFCRVIRAEIFLDISILVRLMFGHIASGAKCQALHAGFLNWLNVGRSPLYLSFDSSNDSFIRPLFLTDPAAQNEHASARFDVAAWRHAFPFSCLGSCPCHSK